METISIFRFRQRAVQIGLPHLTIATALWSAGGAGGQCQYEVTLLDYPIDCALSTVITNVHGLNEASAVVGSYRCPLWTHTEAFLWTPEDGFATLPRPPGVGSSSSADISDDGTIVGSYTVTDVGVRGFIYEDGQYTELPPPPGSNHIWVYAIDNQGMVAGAHSLGSNPSQPSAYVWTPEEGFTYLGVMNGPYSLAGAIGPLGQVTGWTGNGGSIKQGFIWQDGELTILPPIPGGATSGAGGITADGLLAGSGRTEPSGPDVIIVGFLWRDGQFQEFIGPLPGYDTSGAGHINSARQVTGISARVKSNDLRGYLWQHGIMHDLNDLVPPGTLPIERAGAINDRGQILADGPGGHAFLLTPVGRPPGELDIDCTVGVTDFLKLLAEWGRPDSPADFNGDGTVDLLDFFILIDNWG
jgi:uncharacterized membrane protein